ncbi:hypothetical protein H5410_014890 [Solanum commersonii]|uniref:Uncharacterized protein n=1 Tax=Solanum commersonii TaxID=4109 RepID=A0A9J5ZSR1_SOLCO|nr:hypothetical protein H5410_014890 [Solanum commersonii]
MKVSLFCGSISLSTSTLRQFCFSQNCPRHLIQLHRLCDHVKLEEKKEDLGEILNGDRLMSGPYALYFLVDKDLEILCRKKLTKDEVAQF